MPFKRDLALQNIPLSKQPQIENEDDTWSPRYYLPATRTNKSRGIVTTRSRVRGLIPKPSHCTWNMYDSCTSLNKVLYFISIYLDWRLGFEPTLQLNGWNLWLRGLQNETHVRASILNNDNWLQWESSKTYDQGEPAVSDKWTGWIWKITGWNSRLQENYQSF